MTNPDAYPQSVHGVLGAEPIIVAEAIHENGMAEYLANRDRLTTDEIFWLGVRAGEAAVRAELGVTALDEPNSDSEEDAETEPQKIANWHSVEIFAPDHGYDGGLPSRLRTRLRPDNLDYLEVTETVFDLTERLWLDAPARFYDLARIDGNKLHFDLDIAHRLLREIVVVRGYAKESRRSTFSKVGAASLSFFADFINHKLELEDGDRLPLVRSR